MVLGTLLPSEQLFHHTLAALWNTETENLPNLETLVPFCLTVPFTIHFPLLAFYYKQSGGTNTLLRNLLS